MDASSVLLFLVVDVLLVLTPGPDWLYVIARSLSDRGWRSGLVAVGGICTAYVSYTVLVATGLAAAVAAVPGVLPALRYAGAAYLVLLALMMLRGARRARMTAGDHAAPSLLSSRPSRLISSRTDSSTADSSTADSSTADTSTADTSTADTSTADTSTADTSAADTSAADTSTEGLSARPSRRERARHAGGGATAARPLQVFGQSFLTGFLNPKALLLFLSLLPQFADPAAALPVGGQLAVLGLLHVACCAAGYAAVAVTAGHFGRRVARSSRLSRGLPFVSAALLLAVAGLTVV